MVDVSKVASMNPDNMIGGGLKDDFDGVITKVRLVPWDYNGRLDHHVLAVAVTIKPDDEEEFTQHYSAGDLENFVPSMDGENGVDLESEEPEGIYALRVGKKEALSNSSNWANFITAALDAGFDRAKLTPAVSCFEGIYGHFNRIPQKKRSGLVKPAGDDQKARNNDILVITEIKEGADSPATAKAPAPKAAPAKTAPAKTTTAPAAGDLDSKLVEAIRAGLKAAGDDGLTKDKLPALALKSLPPADKGKGVKRIVDPAFLSAHEDKWAFDAESGLVISVE